MACITGGRRCERILTGGQTALVAFFFEHPCLGWLWLGVRDLFSVMRLLVEDRIVVAGSLLM